MNVCHALVVDGWWRSDVILTRHTDTRRRMETIFATLAKRNTMFVVRVNGGVDLLMDIRDVMLIESKEPTPFIDG